VTHSCVRHDSFIRVMWLIHVCDTNSAGVWSDLFICTKWLMYVRNMTYGVATISRLLKIIGLFCKRALSKRRYSAKETYSFKEPTNRSHPIFICVHYAFQKQQHNHRQNTIYTALWYVRLTHRLDAKKINDTTNTGWPRPIGCLFFTGHFLQMSPIINGSFAKNDVQQGSDQSPSGWCILGAIILTFFFCWSSPLCSQALPKTTAQPQTPHY